MISPPGMFFSLFSVVAHGIEQYRPRIQHLLGGSHSSMDWTAGLAAVEGFIRGAHGRLPSGGPHGAAGEQTGSQPSPSVL